MVEADNRYIQISENGVKTATQEKIFLTTKFKGILWTSDPNAELPIKMPQASTGPGTEAPLTLSNALIS
jgi:hypothetical protein